MAKGWKLVDGYWYYLDPTTGIMATGWLEAKGLWYYLDPSSGAMQTGWKKIDGEWYFLETDNGDGRMVTGWKKEVEQNGETWYFLFETGAMAHSVWLQFDGKWYYFRDSSGQLETGKIIEYNDKKYYVGEDGVMITKSDQETVEYKNVTYEVAEDGVCTAITTPLEEKIEKWMDCVEQIATWYTENVTTYLAGGSRKNYYCPLINMNTADDCSSMVAACLVKAGIATTTTYYSNNYNKRDSAFTSSLGTRLENYGFVWIDFDENYIPQRGEISVQHGYYYVDGVQKPAKHVEVVENFDASTNRSYIWSWGQVNPTLPTSRTNWTTRTSGCWRIMN